MALIHCPDCQTEVSEMAVACVKCGRPISEPPPPRTPAPIVVQSAVQQPAQVVYAKRTFNSILAVAWVSGLSGCVACSSSSPRAAGLLWTLAFLTWVASRFYTYG